MKKRSKNFAWSGVAVPNDGFSKKKAKTYIISLSLRITTNKGVVMAKRVFSNVVRADLHHPFLNLEVKEIKENES